jgi:Lrp/AsnC family leucine-responsive transcriptional regulator
MVSLERRAGRHHRAIQAERSRTRRFFYGDPDIKNFKTMVVMDRVKVGFALPLAPVT